MNKRIMSFVLLALVLATNAMAQQPKVLDFAVTSDFIPADDQRRDFNKQLCALVKVQVVDQITDIEGNVMGDIVNHGVEKWVYMAKGSRNMKIHFKNNLPIKVMFKDWEINGLESNRVYVLTIEVENNAVASETSDGATGRLSMVVTPTDATVTIWSERMGTQVHRPQNDGTLVLDLPYEQYYYKVEAKGHKKYEGGYFVTNKENVQRIALTRLVGTLTITCPTPKTEFYINGERVKKRPRETTWKGDSPIGQVTVEARQAGYATQRQTIKLEDGDTQLVTFFPMQKDGQQNDIADKAKNASPANNGYVATGEKLSGDGPGSRQTDHAQSQSKPNRSDGKGFRFGLVAGLNVAKAKFKDSESESVYMFHFGGTADYYFGKHFGIGSSLLISAKGYEMGNSSYKGYVSEKGNPMFVDFSLVPAFRIPLGKVNMEIACGPYFAFCVSGSVEGHYSDTFQYNDYNGDFSDTYTSFDCGLQAGIDFGFARHIHAGIQYQTGLSDSYANRNLMISVGYRF